MIVVWIGMGKGENSQWGKKKKNYEFSLSNNKAKAPHTNESREAHKVVQVIKRDVDIV